MHTNDFTVFAALFLVLYVLFSVWFLRFRIKQSAKRISKNIQSIYVEKHDYQKVNPNDFPWLDIGFYSRITDALTRQGFSFVTDIEDLTLSRQLPNLRTFTRVMAGDDGSIRVEFFNIRPLGAKMWFLRLIGAVSNDFKTCVAWTEFIDGHYINTSNKPKRYSLSAPKEIDPLQMPEDTPIGSLVNTHRDRIKTYLSANPGTSVIPVNSYNDVIAVMNRIVFLMSKHRKSLGGLTREEMDGIVKPAQKGIARKVFDEMQRQKFNPGP